MMNVMEQIAISERHYYDIMAELGIDQFRLAEIGVTKVSFWFEDSGH